MTPDLSQLLPEIIALADAAGAETLRHFRKDGEVREKADKSPVTVADEAAERIILAGLKILTPDIPVVAEEEAAAGNIPDVGTAPFWLVDPLDGTREFIAGRDEYTVNIALIEDGVPVLGVVLAPAQDVSYWADGIGRAMVRRKAEEAPQPITAREAPEGGAVVTASRSHGDQKKIQALMDKEKIGSLRISGSSIKFCLVADGTADVYPRYGSTREWDTAAGHAVLRAAGGSVRKFTGEEMVYGKEDFLNPEFIARGRDR
jgi:3'(2'), 5'-bisphosphate nucleotidase